VGLRDVSGVFSREFIVGYFAPAFFIVIITGYSLDWAPDRFQHARGSDQVLLIGGVALLVALLLNGLRHPLTSIYAGIRPADVMGLGSADIEFRRRLLLPTAVADWRKKRLQAQFDELQRVIESGGADARKAQQIRDARLGSDREQIGSTRFGAARGAVQAYAKTRWNFDLWYAWPRIHPLLSETELALRRDAEADQAFFLNSAFLTLIAGSALSIDEVIGDTTYWRLLMIPIGTMALHWILYRFAVQAAERAATRARASIDLHYPELMTRLGAEGHVAIASSELDQFWLKGVVPPWFATVPTEKDVGKEAATDLPQPPPG
jgi:hypothetical protein